jgi:hypothetical protein
MVWSTLLGINSDRFYFPIAWLSVNLPGIYPGFSHCTAADSVSSHSQLRLVPNNTVYFIGMFPDRQLPAKAL